MPKEDKNILKRYHEKKFMKIPFIINADMECLLKNRHLSIIEVKNV